jgi:hypothetical protein
MTAENEADAIDTICRDLNLPSGGAYCQDWAYELPDEFRTSQWASKYMHAYENVLYGNEERKLLIKLILDITNDLLETDHESAINVWLTTKAILRRDSLLHQDKFAYWASADVSLEDAFALTPLMRDLCDELSIPITAESA